MVSWAEGRDGLAVATTMGLVTMSLLHIAASLEWRDPYQSVFSRSTIANGRFNMLMLTALALTLLVTTIPLLQRIFDTVDLDGRPVACLPDRGRRLLRARRAGQAHPPPIHPHRPVMITAVATNGGVA